MEEFPCAVAHGNFISWRFSEQKKGSEGKKTELPLELGKTDCWRMQGAGRKTFVGKKDFLAMCQNI